MTLSSNGKHVKVVNHNIRTKYISHILNGLSGVETEPQETPQEHSDPAEDQDINLSLNLEPLDSIPNEPVDVQLETLAFEEVQIKTELHEVSVVNESISQEIPLGQPFKKEPLFYSGIPYPESINIKTEKKEPPQLREFKLQIDKIQSEELNKFMLQRKREPSVKVLNNNDYVYRLHSIRKNGTKYYQCGNRKTHKCRSYITILSDGIIFKETPHSCSNKFLKTSAKQVEHTKSSIGEVDMEATDKSSGVTTGSSKMNNVNERQDLLEARLNVSVFFLYKILL
jgi:hypothetical protein